jgi:hypothetical protein
MLNLVTFQIPGFPRFLDTKCIKKDGLPERAVRPTGSKSQFFQILFPAPPPISAEQVLPELVIIAAGFDG